MPVITDQRELATSDQDRCVSQVRPIYFAFLTHEIDKYCSTGHPNNNLNDLLKIDAQILKKFFKFLYGVLLSKNYKREWGKIK